MKFLNGILGIAILMMTFACEPEDSTVSPQDNTVNQNDGNTNLSAVSEPAQDVLEISSKMQILESIGFGRPSILNSGFGFADRGAAFANGRVRTDDDDDDDADDDDDDWEDWELDEEFEALIDEIEQVEHLLDSLEEQLNITTDEQQRAGLEEEIELLEDKLDDLEEDFEIALEDFEDEHGEFYIEDCEYTTCAEETFEDNDDGSYTWTIDYGDGCEEYDGVLLTGKIIETFTEDGNSFSGTIIYENFGEDDYKVSGTETFSGTFEGDEDDDYEEGSYAYSESLEVTVDGETFTVTGSGKETFDSLGYTIEGSWRYETANGDFAESEITTPLYFSMECEYQDVFEPVSGVEKTIFQEGSESGEFIIDFGNGECDNIVTITEDGETYEVDLEEEWEDEDEDDD